MDSVRRVVLISAMGGTDPDHPLNLMMSRTLDWKRKSEQYFIKVFSGGESNSKEGKEGKEGKEDKEGRS